MTWKIFTTISVSGILRWLNPPFGNCTNAARSLKRFPHRGRIGQHEGTRELVMIPMPYIIVYSVEQEIVHILRIIHAARDRRRIVS